MTFPRALRPALVCLFGLSGAACGMVDSDPHRFETMARGVAAIPLDGGEAGEAGASLTLAGRRPEAAGLRPAMRVEVMDPHAFWDARDRMVQDAVDRAAPAVVEAAAPVVAEAVVQQVSGRVAEMSPMRPAVPETRTSIQLGAYSSEGAARAAWARLRGGTARMVLADLSPAYEMVRVDGKPFTRLKVSAPVETAAAICHAAQVTDPWCLRRS